MAFLTALTLLTSTALTLTLFPFLFRLVGRALGAQIRSKTQQRRDLLLARAAAEEEQERASPPHTSAGSQPADSSTSLDDDWEKVRKEEGRKTPPTTASPPNTTTATSPTNITTNNASQSGDGYEGIIAFFHPFCNAGGGGERVLFAAIEATQQKYPRALCLVYTGDHDASKAQILSNVRTRFNIALAAPRIAFLYLGKRDFVLASKWPHFTLLGQSLGSLILGWEAFGMLAPDIFIDTMGYAFTLGLCKWLFPDCPTGAYVHYPTISTDMIRSLHSDVASGEGGLHAGMGQGARGKVKEIYWELFAKLYCWVGGHVDVVMTNSTWTQAHMQSLWRHFRTQSGKQHAIEVVYPPCAVGELQEKIPITLESEDRRTPNLLYIAQFRPEKNHTTILSAFTQFLKSHPNLPDPKPKLILVGSVRDDHDEKRVYKLRLQAQEVKDQVEFVVNSSWDRILELLRTSSVGVNGMWNEHFGIGVVEYQAAGLISVVSASGGPKMDIVTPVDGKPTGKSSLEEQMDGRTKWMTLVPLDPSLLAVGAIQAIRAPFFFEPSVKTVADKELLSFF